MRKGTIMVALAALLVAIFATAAYALTADCTGGPCYGTKQDDHLDETQNSGDDQMYTYRGEDVLHAFQYPGDTDKLYGGPNNDQVDADDGDGNDLVVGGGGGDDRCWVDAGDEVKSCDGNVFRDLPIPQ